jgi:sulfatase maturation enzyme AslB (radical SAM superfamily)
VNDSPDIIERVQQISAAIEQALDVGDGDTALALLDTGRHEVSGSLRARREIDDLVRRSLFSRLNVARKATDPAAETALLNTATEVLGPRETWLSQLKQYLMGDRARLVVVLTWQCETRCTYCTIPKQDGREMSANTLDSAIELLMSSGREKLELRFFGGEPLMAWEQIQHGIESAQSVCEGRDIQFMITTNGYALTPERIAWLGQHPVQLQVALDGLPEAHNVHRKSIIAGEHSYDHSAIDKASLLQAHGVAHEVIHVVHPARIREFVDDFDHIADQGFERIQINWAHNLIWHEKHLQAFADGLHKLGTNLRKRWAKGESIWLVNLGETLLKIRTFREITVDHDGQIYANNAFLYRPSSAPDLCLGHLDDGHNWWRYRLDGADGEDLKELSFAPPVAENNARVGSIFSSWVRWMQSQGLPDF